MIKHFLKKVWEMFTCSIEEEEVNEAQMRRLHSIEDEEVIEEHEAQMRRLHEEQEEEGYYSIDEEDEVKEEEEEHKWARVKKEQEDGGYYSTEYELLLLCNPKHACSISELAKLLE